MEDGTFEGYLDQELQRWEIALKRTFPLGFYNLLLQGKYEQRELNRNFLYFINLLFIGFKLKTIKKILSYIIGFNSFFFFLKNQ